MILNSSSAVALFFMYLQNSKSSHSDSPFTSTYEMNKQSLLLSVASSTCNAKRLSFNFSMSCSSRSLEMLHIRLATVSFDGNSF